MKKLTLTLIALTITASFSAMAKNQVSRSGSFVLQQVCYKSESEGSNIKSESEGSNIKSESEGSNIKSESEGSNIKSESEGSNVKANYNCISIIVKK